MVHSSSSTWKVESPSPPGCSVPNAAFTSSSDTVRLLPAQTTIYDQTERLWDWHLDYQCLQAVFKVGWTPAVSRASTACTACSRSSAL